MPAVAKKPVQQEQDADTDFRRDEAVELLVAKELGEQIDANRLFRLLAILDLDTIEQRSLFSRAARTAGRMRAAGTDSEFAAAQHKAAEANARASDEVPALQAEIERLQRQIWQLQDEDRRAAATVATMTQARTDLLHRDYWPEQAHNMLKAKLRLAGSADTRVRDLRANLAMFRQMLNADFTNAQHQGGGSLQHLERLPVAHPARPGRDAFGNTIIDREAVARYARDQIAKVEAEIAKHGPVLDPLETEREELRQHWLNKLKK